MAEFKRPEDIVRVVRGTRLAERQEISELPIPGPPPTRDTKVVVQISGEKITSEVPPFEGGFSEKDFYPASVFWRNSESLSNLDKWIPYEGITALVEDINESDLTVGTKYKGTVEGYRNGKPLVTVQIGDSCPRISDKITDYGMVNGKIRLSWIRTDENCEETEHYRELDGCIPQQCCEAATLTSIPTVTSPTPHPWGEAGVTLFEVSANGSGGVSPYIYQWNWGDGTATDTQQNTGHIYEEVTEVTGAGAGAKQITLSVTDECGTTATNTVWVYVYGGNWCECIKPTTGGTFPARLDFTLANGDGDFAGANGDWSIYYIGNETAGGLCEMHGDLDGWTARGYFAEDDLFYIDISDPDGVLRLSYVESGPGICEMSHPFTLDDSTGTGTTPDNFTTTPAITADACTDCPCELYSVDNQHPNPALRIVQQYERDTATTWIPVGTDVLGLGTLTKSGTNWSFANAVTGCTGPPTASGWGGQGCQSFPSSGCGDGMAGSTMLVCCEDE